MKTPHLNATETLLAAGVNRLGIPIALVERAAATVPAGSRTRQQPAGFAVIWEFDGKRFGHAFTHLDDARADFDSRNVAKPAPVPANPSAGAPVYSDIPPGVHDCGQRVGVTAPRIVAKPADTPYGASIETLRDMLDATAAPGFRDVAQSLFAARSAERDRNVARAELCAWLEQCLSDGTLARMGTAWRESLAAHLDRAS